MPFCGKILYIIYLTMLPNLLSREVIAMLQTRQGHLKIFFSYAKNSGKTLAMLKAAQEAKTQGVSVLIGYIAHIYGGVYVDPGF